MGRQATAAWTLGPGPDELSLLVTVGDQQAALGLGRMWRHCEAGAEDCEATVRAYLDQAIAGLGQMLHPPKLEAAQLIVAVRSKGATDAYRDFPQGFYTSSYLYPHEAWTKVATRFGGQLLVSVPANDVLLYADGRHRWCFP